MSDSQQIAQLAAAEGISPTKYVKDLLIEPAMLPFLPQNVNQSITHFSPEIPRALLFEAIKFYLRSMSQLVSYETLFSKNQFSWGLVALYYSSYFSALSMNRLAGCSITTLSVSGNTFEINAGTVSGNYTIKRIRNNNHIIVWDANYRLFSNFVWIDSSLDGYIIKVTAAPNKYLEKRRREFYNYHPESYQELSLNKGKITEVKNLKGQYYGIAPTVVSSLPLTDGWIRDIAYLESTATARHLILTKILSSVLIEMGSKSLYTSERIFIDIVNDFARNMISQPPFDNKLRREFHEYVKSLTST
jgi:hypothetical protein